MSRHLNFSSLYAALALGAPLLMLAGCGGGGSGGSGSSGPTAPTTPTATPSGSNPAPTATPISAQSGELFSDDFASPSFDLSKWGYYGNSQQLQRTFFGNVPVNMNEDGTSFTRLTLDSYNPSAPGKYFRGTEIYGYPSFAVGNGLEAEARLRGRVLTPGIVFAFFLISDRYVGGTADENYRKDEIDYEFLTAQTEQIAGDTRNQLYTNVWNDWNATLYKFDGDNSNNGTERLHDDKVYQASVDPDFDYNNWNVYKIRWLPDRTEFYVNGRLERTETEVKPNQALQLHFNIWTPTGDFNQAFSGNLPGPASSASDNRSYSLDVDYVRVTALTAGANAARIASGSEAAKPLPSYLRSYRSR